MDQQKYSSIDQDLLEVSNFVKTYNIDLEIMKSVTQELWPRETIKLCLTSRSLGGLLITRLKPGNWSPCFPVKPNYPAKHIWYVPIKYYVSWQNALRVALCPSQYLKLNKETQGYAVAVRRANSLRDNFQVNIMLAIIKDYEGTINAFT